MPEMDGMEAVKQILLISGTEKPPVIIGVSATLSREVVEGFRLAGAKDVLEKPVTMDKLQERLEAAGITVSSDGQETEAERQEDGIGVLLSGVMGLDYKKGIEMLAGSVENYMKVLGVCVKNIQDNYNSIDMIKGTKQFESFALYFHSLKGIFLNIGADKMGERSRELEMAAKECNMDWIEERLEKYMEDLTAFHESLREAYERYAANNQPKQSGKPVSQSEFAKNLDELRQHIEDFEYIEITEKLESMLLSSQGAQKEGLENISNAIQDFDYDGALEILEALKAE
jgi:CheY-like chemotaxis protein